jgi:hypothetical protein
MNINALIAREGRDGEDVMLWHYCAIESIFKNDELCRGTERWLVTCEKRSENVIQMNIGPLNHIFLDVGQSEMMPCRVASGSLEQVILVISPFLGRRPIANAPEWNAAPPVSYLQRVFSTNGSVINIENILIYMCPRITQHGIRWLLQMSPYCNLVRHGARRDKQSCFFPCYLRNVCLEGMCGWFMVDIVS